MHQVFTADSSKWRQILHRENTHTQREKGDGQPTEKRKKEQKNKVKENAVG